VSDNPVENLRTIGDAVRAAREARQMSQRDLARVSGVGLPSLLALEEGRPNPPLGHLMKLAEALGTRPSVLIRDAEARVREQAEAPPRRWQVHRSADELDATLTLTLRADWLVRLLSSRLFKRDH
jgi:transcriptional regulator with XRE-family HTH domain